MKFFYVPGTCSFATHIVLREAEIPFELDLVDRKTKITASGIDYKALNPKGSVPGIQLDDGQVLTEGTAILQYLADQRPAKRLAPAAGTMEHYRMLEWLNFIATDLHKGFAPFFSPLAPEEMKQAARVRLVDRFGFTDRRLAGKSFLMGDSFTIADAYLFVMSGWATRFEVPLGTLPNLSAYFQRLAERPSIQAALNAEAPKK
jgi:glutathione S-transferase